MQRLKLGELLIEEGTIDSNQLTEALAYQKRWGKKIGECLVDLQILTERGLCEILSKTLRIPIINLTRLEQANVTKQILQNIPLDLAKHHRIVPLSIREVKLKRRLVVATSDPLNYKFIDELQFKTSLPILPMIAPDSDIEWFIRKFYLGEANAVAQGYVSVVQHKGDSEGSEYLESVSSIFSDAQFTNVMKQYRKKLDD